MSESNSQKVSAWFEPTSPVAPRLDHDAVHIWCAVLDTAATVFARLQTCLSDEEWKRAERFSFERDRNRYVVRRAVLRTLLGRYTGIDPARITFRCTERGKLHVAPPLDVEFNLSHSQDLALFAFARRRVVGVDIEWMRPLDDAMTIARRFFSPAENAALNSVAESQRTEAFFNCWTRKEAFVKATGEGLQRSLDSFDVSLTPGEPARLLRCADCDPAAWSLHGLRPAVDFIGAVAAPGEHWTLQCWQWSHP
jgi:4'-phosphopantetheinyl transferase